MSGLDSILPNSYIIHDIIDKSKTDPQTQIKLQRFKFKIHEIITLPHPLLVNEFIIYTQKFFTKEMSQFKNKTTLFHALNLFLLRVEDYSKKKNQKELLEQKKLAIKNYLKMKGFLGEFEQFIIDFDEKKMCVKQLKKEPSFYSNSNFEKISEVERIFEEVGKLKAEIDFTSIKTKTKYEIVSELDKLETTILKNRITIFQELTR